MLYGCGLRNYELCDLEQKDLAFDRKTYDELLKKKWVVYAKQAFCTPSSVIEYLGRYSHKVAISNHRILKIDKENNTVTFSFKNYKKDGKKEILTLKQEEFIRLFSLHVLPKGFTRIRHYGILSGTWKRKNLKVLQEKLNISKPIQLKKEETKLVKCRICKKGIMETIFAFYKTRPPPKSFLKQLKKQNELIINRIQK
jgi:hypothetical protein